MLVTSTCPSRRELRDYLVGQLSDTESSAVEDHLQNCRCCEGIVEQLDTPSLENHPSDVLLRFLPQAAGMLCPSVKRREGLQSAEVGEDSGEQERSDELEAPSGDDVDEPKADSQDAEGDQCFQDPVEVGGAQLLESELAGKGADQPGSEGGELAQDDSWADIASRKLSSYELVKRIGSGGMGMVYRARHRSLDKWVAVKLLPARRGTDAAAVGRFQREMRLVGRLNHPAIVSATDAGLDGETHFLVMELIDGLDLSRVCRSVGRIAPADAAEIGRQVALGLDHAHAQGVIHRDIKPSNLMLDGQGQVKLLDLGLADLCPWCQPVDDWTTVGQLLGTLDYMAPEQADGQRGVSHRSDLYSLGATLFRLVAGRPPLAPTPDGSPLEKLRLLATERPPAVRTLCPELPVELAKTIDQLLDRDPARRPSSAAAVAEQLAPLAASSDLRSLIDTARQTLHDGPDEVARVAPDGDHAAGWPPAEAIAGSSPQPAATTPGSKASGWKRGGSWITALLLGAAGGAIVLGTILIILETLQGQLVIETDQADLRVRVVSEGEPVRHLELQPGANTTRLRADKYEIIIDQAVDRTVMIENGSFELRRGETVVARIRSQPGDGAGAVAETAPNSQGAIYEGKTIPQWIDALRNERSLPKTKEAIAALVALRPEDPDGEIVELVLDAVRRNGFQGGGEEQLLTRLISPVVLSQRLLRDMASATDRDVRHYAALMWQRLWPNVTDADDFESIAETFLEVFPELTQPPKLIADLAQYIAIPLAAEHAELAEEVLNTVFRKHYEHDGLLFGAWQRATRPLVLRRYIIADKLRYLLNHSADDSPDSWWPLIDDISRNSEEGLCLEQLVPSFRLRMLERIGDNLAKSDQRKAWGDNLRQHVTRHLPEEPIREGLHKLHAASNLDSDLGAAPGFDAFHYLLITLLQFADSDDEILTWLRSKRDEVKDAHERIVELSPVVLEFHKKLMDAILNHPGRNVQGLAMVPGLGLIHAAQSPLSYGARASGGYQIGRGTQSARETRIPGVDIEPLDREIVKAVTENLTGYWDYILLTGAINLLTNGDKETRTGDSTDGPGIDLWIPWTAESFDKARKDGHVVVLDFTAEWCLNCKVLKATVLNRDPVRSLLAEDDIVKFTVDLTSTSAPGWDFLRDELGQTGIPLLAIYSPGKEVPWQSTTYTGQQVVSAVRAAREQKSRTGDSTDDAVQDPVADAPAANADAVYGGRTARQWMDELPRERSVAKIQEGMAALLALKPEIPEDEVVELILQVVRRHGVEALNKSQVGERRTVTVVQQLIAAVTSPADLSRRLLRDMAAATDPNVERYAALIETLALQMDSPEDLEAIAETYFEVLSDLSQSPESIGSLSRKIAERLLPSHEELAVRVLDATFHRFHDHDGRLFGSLYRPQPIGSLFWSQRFREDVPPALGRYVIADQFRFVAESATWPDFRELLLALAVIDQYPEEVEAIRKLVPEFLPRVLEQAWSFKEDIMDRRQGVIWRAMIANEMNEATRRNRGANATMTERLTELKEASGFDIDLGLSSRQSFIDIVELRHFVLLILVKTGNSDEELLTWLRARREKARVSYDGFVEFVDVVAAWEVKLAAAFSDAGRPAQDAASIRNELGSYPYLIRLQQMGEASTDQDPQTQELYEKAGIQPLKPEVWKAAAEHFPGYWDYILITGAINLLTKGEGEN